MNGAVAKDSEGRRKIQLLYWPAESRGQQYRHGDRWIRLPIL